MNYQLAVEAYRNTQHLDKAVEYYLARDSWPAADVYTAIHAIDAFVDFHLHYDNGEWILVDFD